MKLSSTAFSANGKIPAAFTCDGNNTNPPLSIADVPAGAKSLALIMEDPDVPKHLKPDGMFDHWVAWNIPPDTTEIPEGQEPNGVIGRNGAGTNKYFGPCPPDREHRYFFKLFALDCMLDLKQGAVKPELLEAIQGHILAEAELMGTYDRKA